MHVFSQGCIPRRSVFRGSIPTPFEPKETVSTFGALWQNAPRIYSKHHHVLCGAAHLQVSSCDLSRGDDKFLWSVLLPSSPRWDVLHVTAHVGSHWTQHPLRTLRPFHWGLSAGCFQPGSAHEDFLLPMKDVARLTAELQEVSVGWISTFLEVPLDWHSWCQPLLPDLHCAQKLGALHPRACAWGRE